MKKRIFVLAAAAVLALAASACGGKSVTPLGGNTAGEVVSNGGFVVEKGDYLYFINGVESYTSPNSFGTPVKGALMRVKKADLSEPEIVVPKLMVAGDYTAGIFIYGDYVYYATPTDAKNKSGIVENTHLDFTRTKLDGTGTPKRPFFRLESNTTPYRIMQTGDNVCVVYYDSANTSLVSYDVATGKTQTIAEEVTGYQFPDEKDSDLIYYVTSVEKETSSEDSHSHELYNAVWQVRGDGSDSKTVLSGIGKEQYRLLSDEEKAALAEPEELQGLTFTLIRNHGGAVYYSTSIVNGDSGLVRYYKATPAADADAVTNVKNAETVLDTRDASVLSATSLLTPDGKIVYLDSQRGIVLYSYDAAEKKGSKTPLGYEETKSATLLFLEGNYVYYSMSSSGSTEVYRIDWKNGGAAEKLSGGVGEDDLSVVLYTGWYAPEVVGGKLFYASGANRTYNYIYAVTLSDNADEFANATPAMIGKMNAADEETEQKAKEEDEENA